MPIVVLPVAEATEGRVHVQPNPFAHGVSGRVVGQRAGGLRALQLSSLGHHSSHGLCGAVGMKGLWCAFLIAQVIEQSLGHDGCLSRWESHEDDFMRCQVDGAPNFPVAVV